MSKGILQLALSGKVPLQLDYREPSTGENAERPKEPAAIERPHHNQAKAQIADALAWLLHVI